MRESDDTAPVAANSTFEDQLIATTPRRSPDELTLPDVLHAQVMDLVEQLRTRPRMPSEAAGGTAVHGGSLIAVFTGESGTGKTLAAEVVATAAGAPLLVVDLSSVVSTFVGETEKNLERIFQAAQEQGAVLVFDEADALFGSRSEVKDASDRYANLETSYLLARLDAFDGLVILTTNARDGVDPAFLRRCHAVVDFPRREPPKRRRRSSKGKR